MYDPFEDAFVVWMEQELGRPPLSLPEAERIIEAELGEAFDGVGVRFDTIEAVDFG